MSKDNIIFDLTNSSNKYKGVLFAEMDNSAVDKECNAPFPTPKGYVVGVMAVIWTDKNDKWYLTARIKFPSGNKQVIKMDFSKPEYKNININETYVLQELYKLPMINKIWTPNPSGESWGILEIMQKLDMIESSTIEVKDAKN